MPRLTIAPVVLGALALSAGLSACSGAGGGGGAGGASGGATSINVLMVNNPQMVDLQKLTADNFTKQSGITVNFTVLPENDLRDKASQEFSSQAGQYDVATLSNFEIPIYAKTHWVADLTSYTKSDTGFDQSDILKPMTSALTVDGKVYGEPFYGES
ncbi:MAG: extracellular solute-binding protein, partial [Actinomycetota bacterium]|nr:extracellular solute-binding protein [Actinomycetota bacterium]